MQESKAMTEISIANAPLFLKPEYEWNGPFNFVYTIPAYRDSVEFPLQRPTQSGFDYALTIALRVNNQDLNCFGKVSLTGGTMVLASVTYNALCQKYNRPSEALFGDDQEWLEVPFFQRHPFYHGGCTNYTDVRLNVRFFQAVPDRQLHVSYRYHLLTAKPLQIAMSPAHRHVESEYLFSLVSSEAPKMIPIPTDKSISEKNPLGIPFQITLRDFISKPTLYHESITILPVHAIYPVFLYVTAFDSENQPVPFKFDKVQVDNEDIELGEDPGRIGVWTFPPCLMRKLTIFSSVPVHHLYVSIEHDQILNYLAGQISTGPVTKHP